jgi:hypothetical protein
MDLKSAINAAKIVGAMVCGGTFVYFASAQQALLGLLVSPIAGVIIGMMFLGILSVFLDKDEKRAIKSQSEVPKSFQNNEKVTIASASAQNKQSIPISSKPSSVSFNVGDPGFFRSTKLTPREFGNEIALHGMIFGVKWQEDFMEKHSKLDSNDSFYLAASERSDVLTLLFAALVSATWIREDFRKNNSKSAR